jgi:hypothetical protein
VEKRGRNRAQRLSFVTEAKRLTRKEASTSIRGRWPEPKGAFLGLLRWNSYGTEGAQPVAKVRRTEGPKMA